MQRRVLGSTGLEISTVAFGAGPVSQLLVGQNDSLQLQTVARAIELGVNWFDTAATYGNGQSESNLGKTLAELRAGQRVHVATKVRLAPEQHGNIGVSVLESVEGSLRRLRLPRVTLLQIHNSITRRAGDQPTSITPAQVLGSGGILEAFEGLRRDGVVDHIGLTGLGEPEALLEVVRSGAFATVQIPYNLLNPSAGQGVPADFAETNHGNVITECGRLGMGVFAIRVLAGGALLGQPPSPHTLRTPFFPLDLYQRDVAQAERMARLLPPGMRREEAAVRFALSHSAVTSAIIGFATPEQVSEIVQCADAGPLDRALLASLSEANSSIAGE